MLSDPFLTLRRGKQQLGAHVEQASLLLLPHIARTAARQKQAKRQRPATTLPLFEEAAEIAR